MEHIEKLENRVNDAEMAGTPRDLFMALVTYAKQIDAQSLENQDNELTGWLNGHGYMLTLEREKNEDEEERLFAVFENTGGHHTRRGMGVMLVRLDEGAHVVGFDRVDEGGQTGRDANAELDGDDFAGVSSTPAVVEPEVPGSDAADDDGEE